MAQPQAWQWPGQVAELEMSLSDDFYFLCKRGMDIALAGMLLILLSPLLLLIALLIKRGSPGPVIYRQERVGARRHRVDGKVVWMARNFAFYKFRSMFDGVDTSLHETYIRDFVNGHARPDEESGGKFKLTRDPRVTPMGRFLRRTSLDELPQLWNVLRGDMSLVGPRPVPPYEVACYRNGDHRRLAALPGITGLWQVNGRCQVPFEKMIEMDLAYIRDASLLLDVKILLQTIPAVLSGRGAE
jgi:Sugar transferases involved in lipopolysaccharide synthesis